MILYFHLTYFHVSYSALFFAKYSDTLFLHRRSLDAFYYINTHQPPYDVIHEMIIRNR